MNSIKYILYARKSSESDDRQIQSIDSQINHMTDYANAKDLNIIKIISEAASSKIPDKRAGFIEMIKLIEKGVANGIITWNPDRLSRNAIDSARLIYLFDQLKLIEIVTPSHTYINEPNDKFMLSIDFGRAKADNDTKGKNVKRGMGDKAKTGWYPAPAPIGYLNSPELTIGKRFIKTNEMLFPYLQSAWKEVIQGTPIFVAYDHALAKWKLDGHTEKFVSKSPFYAMFHNPFYYGRYEYPKHSGNWFDGKHLPMISKAEFDHVQKLCGLSKPTRNTHDLPFKGLFRCKA